MTGVRWLIFAIALLGSAGVASAQTLAQPPASLDCARASTTVDKTICGKADLLAANRKLKVAYDALHAKLSGAAREHLTSDQARWLANRNKACIGEPAEIEDCLETRLRDRAAALDWEADGAYPMISEQAVVKAGKARGIPYVIDASYPQFDATTVDFSAVNRQLESTTNEAADRVIPGSDTEAVANYTGPAWVYSQAYTLHHPGPNAVTVNMRYDSYEGGAHGIVGVWGLLVDLRTGKAIGPDAVFLPTSNWLRELTRIASADIGAPNLADMLKDPRRYVFVEDHLELSFAPQEGGPYTVEIPYDRLRSMLRVDGPVPRLRWGRATPVARPQLVQFPPVA